MRKHDGFGYPKSPRHNQQGGDDDVAATHVVHLLVLNLARVFAMMIRLQYW